ncbi:RNA polymerase sigma factor [Mucilaginibacter sp.]|uniref:RNA polymerase sigma factor n=1 Tax=Mucilaginibacter sp. TaxID=1882438 RepID=UPI003AFF6452
MSPQPKNVCKNWQLLAEGEKQGLYECFNIFYDDLYRFGLSLYKNPGLVKESIHNLFLELWHIKHKLGGVQNIQQYILVIFKRILYKTYRQCLEETQTNPSATGRFTENVSFEPSYEAILIASQQDEQMKIRLQNALEKLSPRQKEVICLRYFDKVAFKDIACQTGLSERTVYNTLHNAIKVLREVILWVLIFNSCWPYL